MSKELIETLKTVLRFIPGVPSVVFKIIDATEGVDTPEEFLGKVNKLLTLKPVGGE